MTVRDLMRHLLSVDLDASVSCININDPHDEFSDTSKRSADLTSIAELDEGVALYYIGDTPKSDDD